MLELQEITKRYDGRPAVDRLSLEVAKGELLVLVGGSGCGKTTTLKMINRLIEPSAGRILIGGEDVLAGPAFELRRRIGYVFQDVGLFPHLNVGANVGVTPRLLGWDETRVRRRTDELLELVDLDPEEYRERLPRELSGGQRQRVGLARALAAGPELVLLDEPFAALDPVTRDRLQRFFARVRHELELTAVLVTHDMAEALILGDSIAVLRDGRLVQQGAPAELLRRPADPYVEELLATPLGQARAVGGLLDGERPAGEA